MRQGRCLQPLESGLAVGGWRRFARRLRLLLGLRVARVADVRVLAVEGLRRAKGLQADAQQLLQDIPVLQEWQRARNPGHKIRDAMLKLGTLWNVPRKAAGKTRPPAEVAQEIEESMLKKTKKIIIGSVAKPATQSDSKPAEASSPGLTMEVPASADAVSDPSAASAATSLGEKISVGNLSQVLETLESLE